MMAMNGFLSLDCTTLSVFLPHYSKIKMHIYIDTEFTDFIQPQLISIGLVSECNQHFYAELNNYDLGRCSDFVKTTVLPQLGKNAALVMDSDKLRRKLMAWLQQFGALNPVIVYDYTADWTLLQNALGCTPPWLTHKNIYREINDLVVERFFMDSGLSDHHALHDAMANKFAHRPPGNIQDPQNQFDNGI